MSGRFASSNWSCNSVQFSKMVWRTWIWRSKRSNGSNSWYRGRRTGCSIGRDPNGVGRKNVTINHETVMINPEEFMSNLYRIASWFLFLKRFEHDWRYWHEHDTALAVPPHLRLLKSHGSRQTESDLDMHRTAHSLRFIHDSVLNKNSSCSMSQFLFFDKIWLCYAWTITPFLCCYLHGHHCLT